MTSQIKMVSKKPKSSSNLSEPPYVRKGLRSESNLNSSSGPDTEKVEHLQSTHTARLVVRPQDINLVPKAVSFNDVALRLKLLKHIKDPLTTDFKTLNCWKSLLHQNNWLRNWSGTRRRARSLMLSFQMKEIHVVETLEYFLIDRGVSIENIDALYMKYSTLENLPQIYRPEYRRTFNNEERNEVARLQSLVPIRVLDRALSVLNGTSHGMYLAPLRCIFVDQMEGNGIKYLWPSLFHFSKFPAESNFPLKYIIPYVTNSTTTELAKVTCCHVVVFIADRETGKINVFEPTRKRSYLNDCLPVVNAFNYIGIQPFNGIKKWAVGDLVDGYIQTGYECAATAYGMIVSLCRGENPPDEKKGSVLKCLEWRKLMLDNFIQAVDTN